VIPNLRIEKVLMTYELPSFEKMATALKLTRKKLSIKCKAYENSCFDSKMSSHESKKSLGRKRIEPSIRTENYHLEEQP